MSNLFTTPKLLAAIVTSAVITGAITAAVSHNGAKVAVATPTPTDVTVVTPAPISGHHISVNGDQALALVKSFYTGYNATPQTADRKTYLSASFAAKLDSGAYGYDPILCAQDNAASFTFEKPIAVPGSHYIIRVHGLYSGQPRNDNLIYVEVEDSTGLISNITCNLD